MEPAAATLPPPTDPDDLEHLGEQIAELAARITAATYQLLAMIRDFDERGGWHSAYGGFHTCAHWLSWRTGLARGPAREKVRVARALGELPALSEAMKQGRISYSKIRALTRVATPANEDELLGVAMAGTATQVERIVRAWRRVDRIEEQEQEKLRHESRHLSLWTDEDGMVVVRGRLDPEAGAALIKAVEAGCDVLYDAEKENEATNPGAVPPAQRRADALGRVAEAALAGGLDKGTRGDRYQVVVHVDAPVLAEPEIGDVPAGTPPGPSSQVLDVPAGPPRRRSGPPGRSDAEAIADVPAGTCRPPRVHDAEIMAIPPSAAPSDVPAGTSPGSFGAPGQSAFENGAHVPAGTSQRIACDASKVVMTHDSDGNILDLGRKTRIISPALRRALTHRDHGCRFPGCGLKFCDAHHVRHWGRGGETRLDNLVLLCRRHHRCVHEEGYRVQPGPNGEFQFLRPDGRPIPAAPAFPGLSDDALAGLADSLIEAGVDLEQMPAYPEWDGSALGLAWAVDTLRTTPTADSRRPNP